jgi:xanthine dehydrogenase accessory factor
MTSGWVKEVLEVASTKPLVRAVVIDVEGSTPREVGAAIIVAHDKCLGTIGGGALEYGVIAQARVHIESGSAETWLRQVVRYHLGPELNQCCGGVATVLLERFGLAETAELRAAALSTASSRRAMRPLVSGFPLRFGKSDGSFAKLVARDGAQWFSEPVQGDGTPLYLYGAGHVGRALVRALDGLPFKVSWGDVAVDRFPSCVRPDVTVFSGDLGLFARTAAGSAFHVVMTHSHALDEVIVQAVIEVGGFSYLGLIGSKTKAARFRHRLLRAGIGSGLVDQLHSPIGLAGLYGKTPAVLSASVVADLLLRRQNLTTCVANRAAVLD